MFKRKKDKNLLKNILTISLILFIAAVLGGRLYYKYLGIQRDEVMKKIQDARNNKTPTSSPTKSHK